MTSQITLSNWARTLSVDITNYSPNFSFIITNPLIQFDPPQPTTGSATASQNFNSVVVNLAMFAPRISLTFTEITGIGDDPFDWSNVMQSSTNFVKLAYLSQIDKELKCLYLNDATNCAYCQIASYRATCVGGQKDIVNHTLELVLISEVNEP